MVGLDDLKGLDQPKRFYDSIIQPEAQEAALMEAGTYPCYLGCTTSTT